MANIFSIGILLINLAIIILVVSRTKTSNRDSVIGILVFGCFLLILCEKLSTTTTI